jgi:hypothetical protein
MLGTYFVVFRGTQSLDFVTTFKEVGDVFPMNDADLVAGCILLLVGAFANRARFRCTPGSRMPWRAPRRSPLSSMPPPWSPLAST